MTKKVFEKCKIYLENGAIASDIRLYSGKSYRKYDSLMIYPDSLLLRMYKNTPFHDGEKYYCSVEMVEIHYKNIKEITMFKGTYMVNRRTSKLSGSLFFKDGKFIIMNK